MSHQEAISQALEQNTPDEWDNAIVTGWALVIAGVDVDGEEYIAKITGPREEGLTSWAEIGLYRWAERQAFISLDEANE